MNEEKKYHSTPVGNGPDLPPEIIQALAIGIGPRALTPEEAAERQRADDEFTASINVSRAKNIWRELEEERLKKEKCEKREREKEARKAVSLSWQEIQARQIEDKLVSSAVEISSRLLGEMAKLKSLLARIPKHRHDELSLELFFSGVENLKIAQQIT